MAKITILPKEMAEKIAAGEVVERPASIIKELTENAIDAGASSITVEMKNGGITFLRVTDNGCGISYEDVPKAFLRHATSKILTERDLEQIKTMGFRGEALASVAAVCRVELLTRTADEISGTRYAIEGLEEKTYEPVGCPVGTTIIVRDIFFNTPARMKFLRKDVAEGNAVASMVEKLALSNPGVSFSLIRDGKETLFTPGDGNVLSAVNAVLGRQFAGGLIPVSYEYKGMKIEGYISRPEASRASRSMQIFFVNGRYVKYAPPFVALTDAYKHKIMTGKFPACVLFLTVNPVLVDVNVHPAKTEVKFASDKDIYDALFFAAKSGLDSFYAPKQIVFTPVKKTTPFMFTDPVQQQTLEESAPHAVPFPAKELNNDPFEPETPKPVQTPAAETEKVSHQLLFSGNSGLRQSIPVLRRGEMKPSSETDSGHSDRKKFSMEKTVKPEENTDISAECPTVKENTHDKDGTPEYRIIGEVFSTYLVVEYEDEVLLIDKHAAHERFLYNRLCRRNAADDRQVLLTPVSVKLARELYMALVDHGEDLLKLGFLADDFGDGYIMVREIPMYLPAEETSSAIEEIAGNFAQHRNSVSPTVLDELLHSIACRSAVKGGDKNNEQEIRKIVEIVLLDRDVKYCPHGRPVAISMTRRQLEKQFGRLV